MGLAILTCMDARIDPADAFGLRPGDAHVLRNAGAVVTDDVLRSLVLSQQLLGTDQVLVVAHTGCGVQGVDDIGLTSQLVADTGRRVGIDFAGFDDLEAHVREQVERIRAHPWVREVAVRGLVYDVRSGRLRPIV